MCPGHHLSGVQNKGFSAFGSQVKCTCQTVEKLVYFLPPSCHFLKEVETSCPRATTSSYATDLAIAMRQYCALSWCVVCYTLQSGHSVQLYMYVIIVILKLGNCY